jgi:hypothetical protein
MVNDLNLLEHVQFLFDAKVYDHHLELHFEFLLKLFLVFEK